MLTLKKFAHFSRKMSSFAPIASQRVKDSKLSIWVEFTTLAAECQAVNLGQGFPDTAPPKFLTDILKNLPAEPINHQYTRGYGHPQLVGILAKMYGELYGVKINANEEVLVTVGAYLALYYTIHGWINTGDEVLIIEPTYDCYSPQVQMAGGVPVPIVMSLPKNATKSSDFTIDFEDFERKITPKTKMLILNNPNNPTGKLYTRQELEKLAEIVKKHNLMVIADEVYEFHVWQKEQMIRFASLPGMYERTISIGSAGKAFSVTGWKLGWAVGPKNLLEPLKAIHQNCVFTCSTPTQKAVAEAFEQDWPKFFTDPQNSYLATGLSSELKSKRDKLSEMLSAANFQPIIPDAGYFMLADYSKHADKMAKTAKNGDEVVADFEFSKWLCREKKLAVIPPSAFYTTLEDKRKNANFVRVCFFKKDETMQKAGEILKQLSN